MHKTPELSETPVLPGFAQPIFPYGVGIDCHSKFIAVCVYVQEDQLLCFEKDFDTTWPQMRLAREWALSILRKRKLATESFRFTIESTGCYHYPVILALKGEPHVVNPTLASASRRKTDRLDARLLAYHSLTGLWPASYFAPYDIQTLRVLLLRRRQSGREKNRAISAINNVILRFGITLASKGSLSHAEQRAVLEDLVAGEEHREHPSIGLSSLPEAARVVVSDLYARFDQSRANESRFLKESLAFAKRITWNTKEGTISGEKLLPMLKSVPGVGDVTALAWLGEVCDPRRFPNAKALAAFCGCDPSLKVSAGKVTAQVRRKGNAGMHRALIQAAQMVLTRRSEAFGRWGWAIYRRRGKGGWFKAVGAVARRISAGLYWVHSTARPFSYDGYLLLPAYEDVPNAPLHPDLLSPRTIQLLAASGIGTARALYRWATESSVAVPGFGPKSKEELGEWLSQMVDFLKRLRARAAATNGHPKEASCSPAESSAASPATSGSAKRSTRSTPTKSSPGATSSGSKSGTASRSSSARRSAGTSKSARTRAKAASPTDS